MPLVRDADQALSGFDQHLLDLLPVAIYICDASGLIRQYNQRAAELWGREPRIGESDQRFGGALRIFQPDGTPMPHDCTPMAEALRTGEPQRDREALIERPDGSLIAVLVNIDPVRDEMGRLLGAINAFQDISRRRHAEDQLRLYRQIFANSNDGIAIIGREGRYLEQNAAHRWLTGYEDSDLEGQTPVIHLGQEMFDRIGAALVQDGVWRGEVTSRHKSGRETPVEISAFSIRDAAGNPRYFVGMKRDISERKRAEDALRELNRRKDEFLAILGHELRNPLAAIVNGIQVLQAARLDEKLSHVCKIVERQSRQMTRLVDDLLDVSRITSGKITLHPERLSITELLRNIVEDHRGTMQAEGRVLEADLANEPLWIDGDPTRIVQIVGNLLHNAMKFTKPGDRIRVVLRGDRESSQAVIQVADEGIGMTAATLADVFEPFRQAGVDRDGTGLGLGLALVRGLVELHGGRVGADSRGPGMGSEFTIRLPLAAGAGSAPGHPRADGQTATNSFDVLLIEDSKPLAEIFSMVLQEMGHEVRVADNAAAGLKTLAEQRPDVIFSDISMPGMSGYDLARTIRATPEWKDVFLVAMTGYGQPEDRERALAAGFDDHLVKPADPGRLQALFATIARHRHR